jgi:PKD repeat protein
MKNIPVWFIVFFTSLLLVLPASADATTPVASFTSDVLAGTVPLSIQFNDTSTGSPTAWAWSFGDGAWSTLQNPSHTYSVVGTYTVALTVTNTEGGNTITRTGYITVNQVTSPPDGEFTANKRYGTTPTTIKFTDKSTRSPTSWMWSFGDGGWSTEQNPTYTFSKAGTFTVTLTATNAAGSNVVTKDGFITIYMVTSPPVASFTSDVTTGTAPLKVQFMDTSTNSPTSWKWKFGDENTSELQNPSHTYASPGTYSVSFTATNSIGSYTTTATDYLTVTAGQTLPTITVTSTKTVTPAKTTPSTTAVTETPTNTVNTTQNVTGTASDGITWTLPVVLVIIALIGISTWIFRRQQRPRRGRGRSRRGRSGDL